MRLFQNITNENVDQVDAVPSMGCMMKNWINMSDVLGCLWHIYWRLAPMDRGFSAGGSGSSVSRSTSHYNVNVQALQDSIKFIINDPRFT